MSDKRELEPAAFEDSELEALLRGADLFSALEDYLEGVPYEVVEWLREFFAREMVAAALAYVLGVDRQAPKRLKPEKK